VSPFWTLWSVEQKRCLLTANVYSPPNGAICIIDRLSKVLCTLLSVTCIYRFSNLSVEILQGQNNFHKIWTSLNYASIQVRNKPFSKDLSGHIRPMWHTFTPCLIICTISFQGNLCCVGSSMFLKKQFGIGYHMTIVKNESVFNREAMNNFVTTYIPGNGYWNTKFLIRYHWKKLRNRIIRWIIRWMKELTCLDSANKSFFIVHLCVYLILHRLSFSACKR
jgi:hypothetical protein